jgi:hypothetical protein
LGVLVFQFLIRRWVKFNVGIIFVLGNVSGILNAYWTTKSKWRQRQDKCLIWTYGHIDDGRPVSKPIEKAQEHVAPSRVSPTLSKRSTQSVRADSAIKGIVAVLSEYQSALQPNVMERNAIEGWRNSEMPSNPAFR